MKKEEIIKLLKSGKFTIAYHNNCCPSLYKGIWAYEKLENKKEIETEQFDNGYCPGIVSLLTEALGGESDSI
jgi:hypothetical protein